jgi:CBS domain containing-hemolysin-like protein
MLLGGLWHGASLKFIIWGGLHGGALAVHKVFKEKFAGLSNSKSMAMRFISWTITFHFVVFCWVFFRADNMVIVEQVLSQIAFEFNGANLWSYLSTPSYQLIFGIIGFGYLIDLIPERIELGMSKLFSNRLWPLMGVFTLIMVIFIYQFKSSDVQPFIYFQF